MRVSGNQSNGQIEPRGAFETAPLTHSHPHQADSLASIAPSAPPMEQIIEKNHDLEAQAKYEQAIRLHQNGEQEASVAALLEALELNPNFDKAHDFLVSITKPENQPRPAPAAPDNGPNQRAYQAIAANNKNGFIAAASQIVDWSLDLGSNDTLVHCAAANQSPFFLNFITKNLSHNSLETFCKQKNHKGFLPLHCAAKSGSVECLKALLKAHPKSVNAQSRAHETALFIAVDNRHSECIEPLAKAGANLEVRGLGGVTPLTKALERNHAPSILLLMKLTKEISKDAIHRMMELGFTRLFKELITKGLDVNQMGATGDEGYRPLHVAVRLGWKAGVKTLMENPKIKLNAESQWGKTALDYAIECNQYHIAEMLLAKGAVSKQGYWITWFRILNAPFYVMRLLTGEKPIEDNDPSPVKKAEKKASIFSFFRSG